MSNYVSILCWSALNVFMFLVILAKNNALNQATLSAAAENFQHLLGELSQFVLEPSGLNVELTPIRSNRTSVIQSSSRMPSLTANINENRLKIGGQSNKPDLSDTPGEHITSDSSKDKSKKVPNSGVAGTAEYTTNQLDQLYKVYNQKKKEFDKDIQDFFNKFSRNEGKITEVKQAVEKQKKGAVKDKSNKNKLDYVQNKNKPTKQMPKTVLEESGLAVEKTNTKDNVRKTLENKSELEDNVISTNSSVKQKSESEKDNGMIKSDMEQSKQPISISNTNGSKQRTDDIELVRLLDVGPEEEFCTKVDSQNNSSPKEVLTESDKRKNTSIHNDPFPKKGTNDSLKNKSNTVVDSLEIILPVEKFTDADPRDYTPVHKGQLPKKEKDMSKTKADVHSISLPKEISTDSDTKKDKRVNKDLNLKKSKLQMGRLDDDGSDHIPSTKEDKNDVKILEEGSKKSESIENKSINNAKELITKNDKDDRSEDNTLPNGASTNFDEKKNKPVNKDLNLKKSTLQMGMLEDDGFKNNTITKVDTLDTTFPKKAASDADTNKNRPVDKDLNLKKSKLQMGRLDDGGSDHKSSTKEDKYDVNLPEEVSDKSESMKKISLHNENEQLPKNGKNGRSEDNTVPKSASIYFDGKENKPVNKDLHLKKSTLQMDMPEDDDFENITITKVGNHDITLPKKSSSDSETKKEKPMNNDLNLKKSKLQMGMVKDDGFEHNTITKAVTHDVTLPKEASIDSDINKDKPVNKELNLKKSKLQMGKLEDDGSDHISRPKDYKPGITLPKEASTDFAKKKDKPANQNLNLKKSKLQMGTLEDDISENNLDTKVDTHDISLPKEASTESNTKKDKPVNKDLNLKKSKLQMGMLEDVISEDKSDTKVGTPEITPKEASTDSDTKKDKPVNTGLKFKKSKLQMGRLKGEGSAETNNSSVINHYTNLGKAPSTDSNTTKNKTDHTLKIIKQDKPSSDVESRDIVIPTRGCTDTDIRNIPNKNKDLIFKKSKLQMGLPEDINDASESKASKKKVKSDNAQTRNINMCSSKK